MSRLLTTAAVERRRWLALYVLCMGVLMIVLDTTVVTVALPSIQIDLKFSGASLVWVLNGYLLTYGGFLLLGGRLGDLYGQRRLLLAGLALFTLASLACGMASSQVALIMARAIQGLGGAVVTAVALALIMTLFTDDSERARAMGIYGFICAAGGSLGELLGGFLTRTLGWHAIFLVNLPIGIAVYFLSRRLLAADTPTASSAELDVAGALSVTASLLLAVYAVVNANAVGWSSPATLLELAAAALLLGLLIWIESRARAPLVPLSLFRHRNLTLSNLLSMLWSAGMFAWFVISALYLQHVLGYDPLRVGLAFLPADLIMAAFSAGLSAKLVLRWGIQRPMWLGLAIAALGLVWFARAPVNGHFPTDVMPGMLLLGLGAGMAFNPLLLASMADVSPQEAGLASGLVNTSFMMGGALGLALLASLAEARSAQLVSAVDPATALNAGYRLAFLLAAVLTGAGALIGALWLHPQPNPQPAQITGAA